MGGNGEQYFYDMRGNMRSSPVHLGDLHDNVANRLVYVENEQDLWYYQYDGGGRRVCKWIPQRVWPAVRRP